MSCTAPADAFLDARLQGAVETALHWRAADMDCDGMQRPDGGLRVTFAGALGKKRLTLVFAAPKLAEGASGRAVPVNVTLIREGGALYSTRGPDKCTLDRVRQAALPPPVDRPPAPGRRWRIEARGFCLEPARAVGGGRDAILLSTFDFRGQLTWESPDTRPVLLPARPGAGAPAPR